jgi:ligand-binding sensor domain-containing protein
MTSRLAGRRARTPRNGLASRIVRIVWAAAGLIGFFSASAAAQHSNVVFERLSLDQGLSQSIVECIIQDSRGFMWFATQDGLNKYDGYKFTVLRQDPHDVNSLSHDNILALCEDHLGFIWVGTFNAGLNRYDPRTGRFTRFRSDRENPKTLSDDYVRSIYEDRDGRLWVATGRGLSSYDRESDTFTRYLSDPADPKTLSNNTVWRIAEDRSGFIWVGTDDGLNRLDPRTGEFTRFRNRRSDATSIGNNRIRSLLTDRRGMLWVGTEGGLDMLDPAAGACVARYRHEVGDPQSLSSDSVYSLLADTDTTLWIGTNGGGLDLLDRTTGRFTSFRNDPFNPLSLSYNEIYALCKDRSGVLWIGTWGGGLDKVNTKRKGFLAYKRDPNNSNTLSHDIVWSILEEEPGILWIGTHGGGLNRLDRRTNRYTVYRHDPANPASLSNDYVRFVIKDRSKPILWIGTDGGGVDRFDPRAGAFRTYRNVPGNANSLSQDQVRWLYQDSRGIVWVGTNGGGLNRFDPTAETFRRYRHDPTDSTSLSNDYVRTVYEDRSGVYWVGTQGGGLNRFDPATGKFSVIKADANKPDGISSDFMMDTYESRDGVMWVATWSGGLDRFDRERGTFKTYTTANGLASNAIYGMLEDEDGNLWLSTNNGLSRFNPKTETFKNYNVQDGLQSREFNAGAFSQSPSGEMFFGGINGFNAFYPAKIRDNPYVPPIVITSFTNLNQTYSFERIDPHRPLKLSHEDYFFSFEFAALDYTAPAKNLYAYRMDGLDRDWVYTDAGKRYASYTTLPAGKYVFRVKGTNSDGVWNEQATALKIVVLPPFWATWWFRTAIVIFLLGLALFFYRRRVGEIRLATELKAAHDAQMSIMPHGDPQVPGFDVSGVCIPASEVGGDFFDYFWLDDVHTKFGIAVGDVSGKAMNAAMIAVMSSGMICSRVDESFSPGKAMTVINGPLFAKTDEHVFTALILASLDARTRTLALSNAGSVEPLLKSGRSVSRLTNAKSNLPLGAMRDTTYEESEVTLRPGDVLVLFTDGLPDAWNGAGEFYDYDRLTGVLGEIDAASLSAKEIKERIVEDVRRFAGGARQHDDMTIVVVKEM